MPIPTSMTMPCVTVSVRLTRLLLFQVEHSVHYLDVTCMESRKPTQVSSAPMEGGGGGGGRAAPH